MKTNLQRQNTVYEQSLLDKEDWGVRRTGHTKRIRWVIWVQTQLTKFILWSNISFSNFVCLELFRPALFSHLLASIRDLPVAERIYVKKEKHFNFVMWRMRWKCDRRFIWSSNDLLIGHFISKHLWNRFSIRDAWNSITSLLNWNDCLLLKDHLHWCIWWGSDSKFHIPIIKMRIIQWKLHTKTRFFFSSSFVV